MQLLAKLVRAEAKIAIRSGQEIVLEPFFVLFQRSRGLFLQWPKVLFHFRRLIDERRESLANELDRAFGLLDCSFGVDARRMLQIRFCLRDYPRNPFHSPTQIRNAFLRRREIPRDQEIKAVRQALVVNERIPIRLF